MPIPLTWDSPSQTWDSGASWDGMALTKRKPMSNIKAIINYSTYTDGNLGPTAHAAHDGVAAHPGTFVTPMPALATFQTHIVAFDAALVAALANPGHDTTLAKNAARAVLVTDLGTLAGYVNLIAQGNAAIVLESGLPSYDTMAPAPGPVRPAPTNLRLKQGMASGSMDVRYTQSVSTDPAELQTCTGDPNVEANWTHAATFPGGAGTLAGFTPGALIWVRVRSIGPGGEHGVWSDPAQLRVI